jgi:NAD(P)-dependent dehydrogenase (short-subunit alcohol dehydrogenase family)
VTKLPLHAFDLTGKVAVVTGGASGIGTGIAAVLAEAGATVVIADRDVAGAEREARALTEAGHEASAVPIDLADEASIVRGCATVVSAQGVPARGPFLMTREIARAMVKAGQGGRIVNVASAALVGSIIKGLAAYTGSKGALLALSRASAFELAEHSITVNTVLPGGVATPGSIGAKGPSAEGPARRPPPLGRCEPRDMGAAVLYFASPAARYVTNQVLTVDGGWSIT